ncbi:RloB domain-containing protein [Amphritea atlantica]|uniref:RloB domain-containing protein n=1 Tax=Amphritea atlantica TaxID=355243 RepID=A0ABY5GV13_9GAMM|nr:RloB domain-containing protein [Amphritea atlantica]
MPKPRKKGKKVKRVNSKLWIYCEGSKTEILYLNAYIQLKHADCRLIEFIDVQNIKETTPKSIINRVVSDKQTSDHISTDDYWVAYDREDENDGAYRLHPEALDCAKQHNINVTISSVCIEQWVLLHFMYSARPYSNFEDLLANSPLKQELRNRGIQNYDKASADIVSILMPLVETARQNADRLNKATLAAAPVNAQRYEHNPYTDFHEVLNAIDTFVDELT